ncbi:hypothetical protein Neosp_012773 [[Neocosmospora] mangrovei]
MRCHKDVFENDGCTMAKQKTAICCLAAVAAVGVQYNGDDFDVGADAVFYDVARHFFENLVEEQPLDAIKACTMLAMYNILNKATVSLAYIGLWPNGVLLVEVEIDHASEVGHIVQIEMTKISLLNADILRMHLSSEEMALQAIDAIDKDLQDWHDLLPNEMHLPNLCRQDLPVEARRSILATHLLYLGTRMLLYRRIASQFVWSSPTRENNAASESYEATLLSHADQAITAAKQSTVDSVALKFRDCVVPIHDKLTSYIFPLPSVNTPHNPSSLGYMLKVPTTADPDRVGLSLKLLTILCQPFSNINSKCGPDESPSKPGESKNLQPDKELNWKVDSCPSFQWNAQSLGIGASVFLEGDNRFMGSDQPSGWTGVEGEDELEELDLVS